jgi:hypothetical protein
MKPISRRDPLIQGQYPTTKCSQSSVGGWVGVTVGDPVGETTGGGVGTG